MATIPKSWDAVQTFQDKAHVITWTPLAVGDVGEQVEMTGAADRSVQVFGTFGVGGTVLFEGSNDGQNWSTLNTPQGTPVAFTSSKILGVLELSRFVRPRVSIGDGTTSVSIVALFRRVNSQ